MLYLIDDQLYTCAPLFSIPSVWPESGCKADVSLGTVVAEVFRELPTTSGNDLFTTSAAGRSHCRMLNSVQHHNVDTCASVI